MYVCRKYAHTRLRFKQRIICAWNSASVSTCLVVVADAIVYFAKFSQSLLSPFCHFGVLECTSVRTLLVCMYVRMWRLWIENWLMTKRSEELIWIHLIPVVHSLKKVQESFRGFSNFLNLWNHTFLQLHKFTNTFESWQLKCQIKNSFVICILKLS